jgi:3,4-dihydroxy 2-butanone 4-phosphate synthase/GTP cyclohydrolase II
MLRWTIDEALETIAAGGLIVVVDDPGRENEGDVVMAADAASPRAINFMAREARGLICLPMAGAALDRLDIGLMVPRPNDQAETNFTVSIDRDIPGSTGISAYDRARTIRAAASPDSEPQDFRRPGHVFPLRSDPAGVLARRGHTEASVDLARLAGRQPAGVICEIMADDGTMARGEQLAAFAQTHQLPLISVADLVEYRLRHDSPLAGPSIRRCADEARLPSPHGTWRAIGYAGTDPGTVHLALVLGDPERDAAPLVAVHVGCLAGDALGSVLCDCGARLHRAMEQIAASGSGVIVYMRQAAADAALLSAVGRHIAQPATQSDAAAIVADLGLRRVTLLDGDDATAHALRRAEIEALSLAARGGATPSPVLEAA